MLSACKYEQPCDVHGISFVQVAYQLLTQGARTATSGARGATSSLFQAKKDSTNELRLAAKSPFYCQHCRCRALGKILRRAWFSREWRRIIFLCNVGSSYMCFAELLSHRAALWPGCVESFAIYILMSV
jgi:hypothetical protein